VLDNTLRDFRLGGAELAPEAQQRFAAIKEELSALSAKFSQNVLDATDAWSLIIEDERGCWPAGRREGRRAPRQRRTAGPAGN
jgi:Zn-dependent oligopeptidase